jgi:Transposase DDE domain
MTIDINLQEYAQEVTQKLSSGVSESLAALIGSPCRKTMRSMARLGGFSYKKLREAYNNPALTIDECKRILWALAKAIVKIYGKGVLLIDQTFSPKIFSEKIEGVAPNRDGSQKKVVRGLAHVVAVLYANNGMVIPLFHNFWLSKKLMPAEYVPGGEIARNIMLKLLDLDLFDRVFLDGAYATPVMLAFMNTNGFKCIMRTHKNRKVFDGTTEARIDAHPLLVLVDEQKSRKAYLNYVKHPTKFVFVAHKRAKKGGGYETVYYVANFDAEAQQIADDYIGRWKIEKCFRTSKQYLGLSQCQSTSKAVQQAHAYLVLLSYGLLYIQSIFKQKSSVEKLIESIRYPHLKAKNPFKTSTFYA